MTFTTAAFGRSSSWLFEASPYRATPKGLPSSFAQLRITVWTGDARDTRMIEVVTVNADSTIRLLESIEALFPMLAYIHVFLDNARYHHAKLVQEWLARPGCRIKLHFIPSYCPHLNPIERLWGLMHRNVTHNKCYATCAQFADATLGFLRETVPRNWADLCDSVTDNFRVINPKDFRVLR
jgi:hypothetical protein